MLRRDLLCCLGEWLGSCRTRQRSRIRVSSAGGLLAADSVEKFRESDPQHGQIGVALMPQTPLVAAPGDMLVGILAPMLALRGPLPCAAGSSMSIGGVCKLNRARTDAIRNASGSPKP